MIEMVAFLTEYFRFDLFGLANILAGIINISLGLFILIQNPRSKLNLSYFAITFTAFIWVTSFGVASSVKDIQDGIFWTKMGWFMGVPFISPSVFLFSQIWTGKKLNPIPLLSGLCIGSFFMLTWFSYGEHIFTLKDHPWGRFSEYHPTLFSNLFMTSFVLFFFTFAIWAFKNFQEGWKNEKDPSKRKQFKSILIGYLCAYTGSIDFLTAWDVPVFPFGFISLTILTCVTAHTIAKYRFLEIKVVLKKVSLAIGIYTLLTLLIIPIFIPLIKDVIENGEASGIFKILLMLVFSGFLFSLGPLIYARFIKQEVWLKANKTTGLTHELKSPLSGIQGSLDRILDMVSQESYQKEGLLDYLSIAKKNSVRLNNYIEDLLSLVKLKDGEVLLEKSQLNLEQILTSSSKLHVENARLKEIKIRIICPADLHFFGDKEKIIQAISNLISNAIKFSNKGEILITAKIKSGRIHITVDDEGIGIKNLSQGKLFLPFFQGSKNSKGSGLGLTIARAWIRLHNGTLTIRGRGKNGTTQEIILPS